jgi:nitrogenase molybdenum-iron protein NifN
VSVSTPSYEGCHNEGFHRTVRAVVEKLGRPGARQKHINLFCGMISPEDMRHLKDIAADFGLDATLLPDYSDALDGGIGESYQQTLEAGTQIEYIRRTPSA